MPRSHRASFVSNATLLLRVGFSFTQQPEWNLLITQPSVWLCKLAEWTTHDMMAHFTHVRYVFRGIAMCE